MKIPRLVQLGAALAGLWSVSANASLMLESEFYADANDCSGYFGSGFDNCTVNGSPSVAKFGYGDGFSLSETNDKYFPSIDGSEFSFDGFDWFYNPGENDPVIRYWTSKNADGFTLFWMYDDSSCTEVDTKLCAVGVTEGSVLGPQLSHVTFYDTGIPEVPEPATLALMGIGLVGLGCARRKNRAA